MKIAGEWELAPEELAGLFQAKGWCYHVDEGLIIPNAATLESMLARLVKEILTTRKDMVQGGRFKVEKDPEAPYSYDLWLNLGYIWDDDALSDEERAMLDLGDDEDDE
ncbi:hypothetical protein [Nonomuraea candida]|uniref:hypothetical protein n=1 Tax=Nonomuraea candida TaxID=359159 RepID=UPI0005B99DD6|nr:hypothetical protein [Nonomuraea candida]